MRRPGRALAMVVAAGLITLTTGAQAKTPPSFTTVGRPPTSTVASKATTTITQTTPTTTTTAPSTTTTAAASSPTTPTTAAATTTSAATGTAAATGVKAPKPKAKRAKQAAKKVKRPVVYTLTGWLSADTVFPQRSLVLVSTPHHLLTPADVKLTENGAAVKSFTLDPLSAAAAHDSGTVLVLDASSAEGASVIGSEMAAARAFTAARPAHQVFGLVSFAIGDQTVLAPTANADRITRALATDPAPGPGANPSGAVHQAVTDLAGAKVAVGDVIVVSDGVGVQGAPIQSAIATANADHMTLITIGLKDGRSTPASLQALARASGGEFQTATPAQLPALLSALQTTLDGDYILHWRSRQPSFTGVTVAASATGLEGTITGTYRTPAAPARPTRASRAPRAARAGRRPAHPHAVASTLLTPWPSFGSPPGSPAPTVNGSFWASPSAVPAVAGICGLLVALALALALHRPSNRAARKRVGSFIPVETIEEYLGSGSTPTPTASSARAGLREGRLWPTFVEAVELARNQHTPAFLVKRAAVIAVVLAVLVTVVAGSPVFALVPLLGWPFVLHKLVMRAAEKQRVKFRQTLPSYVQDVASAMRVGRSFAAAIGLVATTADEPTRSEFDRAATDESLGRPLEESLEHIAKRMQSDAMDQIALIAGLHRRTGSNVAEAMDRVAEGARDRADLQREMKALTGQAKMSSSVLTGLPGVLLVGLALLSPDYAHPLFHTTMGKVALGFGFMLVFIGWKVMGKITRVEV